MDPHNQLLSFLKDLESNVEETWLNEYLDGDKSIVHSLIYNMADHFDDINFVNRVMRGLKKIYDINPQTADQQIKENKKFPSIIVNYLTQIPNPQHEVLLMLKLSFNGNRYHHQLIQLNEEQQKQFVTHILNQLITLDDEELFTVFVLLICEFWDNEKIAKFCLQHDNIRFFQEFLLEYLNRTNDDVSKPLFFIETVLKLDKDFFYVNNFKALQQLSIRQINDGTQAQRQYFLRNLNVMVYYGNFEQILVNQIMETMEMVQNNFDDHYSLRKSKQVIDNLKR